MISSNWKKRLAAHLRRKAEALAPAEPPKPVLITEVEMESLSALDDLGRIIGAEATFDRAGQQVIGESGVFILPGGLWRSLRAKGCLSPDGNLTARGKTVVHGGLVEFNGAFEIAIDLVREEEVPQFVQVTA